MKEIILSNYVGSYPVGENVKDYLQICKQISEEIQKLFPGENITLWCRGSSGAIISALIAQHFGDTGITICHVKKPNEEAHRSLKSSHTEINIIVDDFMASGSTVKEIYNNMYVFNLVPRCIIMTGHITRSAINDIFQSEVGRIEYLIAGGFY